MRTGPSIRWALACVLVGWAAYAAAPPPLWRALTAQEQKEVNALETRRARHAMAGEFEQAAAVAEEVAAYRARRQGVGHWQAIDARFRVEEWQCLAKVPKQDRAAVLRARVVNSEGVSLANKGRSGEAEKPLREALEIGQKTLGEQHPDTAAGYNNVASCLDRQGKHSDALPLFRQALDIRLKALGEQHPDTATSYNNVAYGLNRQGKDREALPMFCRARDIRLKTLGELHPDTASSYNYVASCLHSQGKHAEAAPLYQKALDVRRKVLGEEHPDTASSYNRVALCLNSQGKHAEALRVIQASLPGQEAARYHTASTGFERAIAASTQSPHAMLAAGLTRLGQPRNAFRHAELSLARGLLDDLAGTNLVDRDRLAALSAELRSLDDRVVPLLRRETLTTDHVSLRDQLNARRRVVQAELTRLASDLSFALSAEFAGRQKGAGHACRLAKMLVTTPHPPCARRVRLWINLPPASPPC